jgi:SAM-dependent methyltransferase
MVDMAKEYDAFAEEFAKSERLASWRFVGKPAMETVLGAFLRPGVKVLDLGSASARVELGFILPHGVKPEDIAGVEISPDQVKIAKERIPQATFIVGDITNVELPQGAFDVAFSHMVFEHLDDAGLLAACKNAYGALKQGGVFGFVVTHPDKMTDLNGNLITEDGAFETTAPWGGIVHNWKRSVARTEEIVRSAGFEVDFVVDFAYPATAPENLDAESRTSFQEGAKKYSKYAAIRLGLRARK